MFLMHLNGNDSAREPSALRGLYDELIVALRTTVAEAGKLDAEKRARVLQRCAIAFAEIDGAMTARVVARIKADTR